jgi:2,4-dienoyl-CoA reductase-like NADH-dependent reductase (Old Yellow Enzyme family)
VVTTPTLFTPLTLRGLTIPHRLWVAPMCQYSAIDGVVQPWHSVHLGAFAIGRAGLVITEATAVEPEGRISPDDAGLWNEAQRDAWKPIVEFSHSQGVPIAIQLAHAGRKASTRAPWKPGGTAVLEPDGGWETKAPSALAFGRLPVPHEMSLDEIKALVKAFAVSTTLAVEAGFDAIELHAAHGYLLHEFLSPLSNKRTDAYGGSLEDRARIVVECAAAIRANMPDTMPLFVRISATDWINGGWDLEQSLVLVRELEALGVDLIDVSSGGLSPEQEIALGPGYQMPFAQAISAEATQMKVGTVGLITESGQAEEALNSGIADVVLMGRQFLREPHYALRAAAELGHELAVPGQYLRAYPS